MALGQKAEFEKKCLIALGKKAEFEIFA